MRTRFTSVRLLSHELIGRAAAVAALALVFTVALPATTRDGPLRYPRSNFLWPFAAGPTYGEVASDRWSAPGVLHTRVGSFDFERGRPDFPTSLHATNRLGQLAAQYFVMLVDPASFNDGRFDAVKRAIEANGGAIVQEMPSTLIKMYPLALKTTDPPSAHWMTGWASW